jgi:hypothetical protein
MSAVAARIYFWRRERHYAARSISGGMARLADLVPDQSDVFCFADVNFLVNPVDQGAAEKHSIFEIQSTN